MSTHFIHGVIVAFITSFFSLFTSHAQWSGATIDTITRDTFRDEIDKQSLAIGPVNTLHAVWKRARTGGGWRIFYSSKPPSGTWSTPQEVGDSSIISFNPALAVNLSFGNKHVVSSASYPSSEEIYSCTHVPRGNTIMTLCVYYTVPMNIPTQSMGMCRTLGGYYYSQGRRKFGGD